MKINKKFDRFQGVTEEELFQRKLEDVIDYDLDILFVNINPGLFSVFKGHHYAGPGNHFYRCLQMSNLTKKALKSWEDHLLLEYKFGLANMLKHPTTKGCQELSAEDIKEARDSLKKRVLLYRPKIVAFNGRSIYEIFTGSLDKEFNYGKQPKLFPDSNALMFVMPSSSARNSQLPKVIDKVPFFLALKMLRDHVNGKLARLSDAEITFPEFKLCFQNADKTKTDFHSMSESNSDSDSNEDKQTDSGKEKLFLNNLSYAELPKDILKNFQEQRILRRNVVISTTTQKFHRETNYSPASSRNPDYDDGSSDGSLNNFAAITNNLSNGISAIKNGHMNGNGKHTNGNHYKEASSPSVKQDKKIRDIVDHSATPESPGVTTIKAMPANQMNQMPTAVSANNLVFVSAQNGNGMKALPQQQANAVQIINGTPNNLNNQPYLRYVLVANQPAATETKTAETTPKSAEQQITADSQRIDISSIDFTSFIPLEQITVERLSYDQYYNFDTLGLDGYDLHDTLRFYYGNDDANTCHHHNVTQQVKRPSETAEQATITKRRCKLNVFDL